jgi:thioredoxin-like negative regulator of GroEL
MNYGITSIPAILFIKGGEVVDKLIGAQPKGNFVKKIEAHIKLVHGADRSPLMIREGAVITPVNS